MSHSSTSNSNPRHLLHVVHAKFWSLVKDQGTAIMLFCVTLALCLVTGYLLIWPAYKNPISRMYTSRLGYASVLRQNNQPFPVIVSQSIQRSVEGNFIGEGLVQSEPIQIPMIAMSGIKRIHAQVGDRVKKGQLLVELDDRRIQMKIAAAEAALKTAKAEYERVKVGSVNILLDERPELGQIKIEAARTELRLEREKLKRVQNLWAKKSMSDDRLQQQIIVVNNTAAKLQLLEKSAEFAAIGKRNSLSIAEAAIREAELALDHRKSQLTDYRSYSPVDGIVERILVHEGEYNQDPGRPAMLLASGIWFQAHLDQTAVGQVNVGSPVEIRLSAFQGKVFEGVVDRIRPMVDFSLGGPEVNRPIRPLGTGAPEWPATFGVRVRFLQPPPEIIPGLTGFSRITESRHNVCVRRGSVSAVSGKKGIVFVIANDGKSFEPRNVSLGWQDDHWTEILSGVKVGETIIVDGYQVLEPGDSVQCQEFELDNNDPTDNRQVLYGVRDE